MITLVSQTWWLVFSLVSAVLAVAAIALFSVTEWRGIQTGEPYTKYLRTWFRQHKWFAILFVLLMMVLFFGSAWLFYHVTFECDISGGIGC